MSSTTQLAVLGLVIAVIIPAGLHQVQEGHIGVYWRGGALLSSVSDPGFHLKLPFVTSFSEVQVTVQTDYVTGIPCGTSGGVMVTFDKVEVVNRLRADMVYDTVKNYTVHYDKVWIFDKLHHELNQFCSSHTLREVYIEQFETLDESLATAIQRDCNKWAPGVEIIAVRVTKPRIPDSIARNFIDMEAEKTKLLIVTETQKVVEKEAETERKKATIQAEKVADVSRINMQRQIEEKEAQKKVAQIEDEMHGNREKAIADAESYKVAKEAEANEARLTPAFLEYMHIMSMANNTKVYFGSELPSMYVDRGSLPSGSN